MLPLCANKKLWLNLSTVNIFCAIWKWLKPAGWIKAMYLDHCIGQDKAICVCVCVCFFFFFFWLVMEGLMEEKTIERINYYLFLDEAVI